MCYPTSIEEHDTKLEGYVIADSMIRADPCPADFVRVGNKCVSID